MIITLLIIVSGCIGGSSEKKADSDYKTGSEGVYLKFMDEAPPNTILMDSNFIIGVEVGNRGSHDVEDGILVFTLENSYIDFLSWGSSSMATSEISEKSVNFAAEGKGVYNPDGDRGLITMNVKSNRLEDQTETHTSTIIATACYDYKTEFARTVCVDTDILNLRKTEKVCTVEDIVLSGGQGGPVGVSVIKETVSPVDKTGRTVPKFSIKINNLGDGQVIAPGKHGTICSSSKVDKESFNKVKVDVMLGRNTLKCDRDTVTLRNKEATVYCELKDGIIANSDSYTSPLTITLQYGYVTTASKRVEIRRIMR